MSARSLPRRTRSEVLAQRENGVMGCCHRFAGHLACDCLETALPDPAPEVGIEACFLADICANPADDAPRLVLADWLDENGDEARATFIRVQCELARVVKTCECLQCALARKSSCCEPSAATCPALRRRERALLEQFGDLAPANWTMVTGATLSRGFVSGVSLTLAAFEQHAAALFAAAPITDVRLTDRAPAYDHNRKLWGWFSRRPEDNLPDDEDLPESLWDFLPPGTASTLAFWKLYDTEALAREALCRAAVQVGRQRANLPEVK